jgi:hypothetical protein
VSFCVGSLCRRENAFAPQPAPDELSGMRRNVVPAVSLLHANPGNYLDRGTSSLRSLPEKIAGAWRIERAGAGDGHFVARERRSHNSGGLFQ